ncbi:hypothetical protein EVAR_96483_1 [Eumeta japonica]|uniref:Uncharacterized protein n=1 Tax=Eumeta variegata TaxID=151549 RepID=A0A4C1VYT9_EUMVA|nr:hypothetical protein EVAR_96483_1 [Eumeta japonica]
MALRIQNNADDAAALVQDSNIIELNRASLSFDLSLAMKDHARRLYNLFAEFKRHRVNLSDEWWPGDNLVMVARPPL